MIGWRAVVSLGVLLAACHAPTADVRPAPSLAQAPGHQQRQPVPRVSAGAGGMSPLARSTSGLRPHAARLSRRDRAADAGVRCKEVLVEPSEAPPAGGLRPCPASVRAAVAAARDLVRVGELDPGLAALEELHHSSPDVAGPVLAPVLHQLALRHYGMGDLDRAQQVWVRVAAVDPSHPTARAAWTAVQRERDGIERGALGLSGR